MERFPTPESLDETAVPHPFFEKMVKDIRAQAAAGTPPPSPLADIELLKAARAQRRAATDASYGAAPPSVKESEREIPMRDGFQSHVRIFQPAHPVQGGSPVVLLAYGGGFCMGENRAMGPYARGLATLYSAVVLAISYRLAPENPFPTGINDAWDSLQWLAANAQSLGGDPAQGFVVGGISAGANIAAVLAQNRLSQRLSPPLTGVWLQVPVVLPDIDLVPAPYRPFFKSREQNALVPVLPTRAIEGVGGTLKPDRASAWYSPFNAADPHKGMPPTYIQVDGMDPLRDDGVIYEKVLRRHGVPTRLTVWPGLPHAHCSFFPEQEWSKSAVRDTFKGFAWLLRREEPTDEAIDRSVQPAPAAG